MTTTSRLSAIIAQHEADILAEWMRLQLSAVSARPDLITEHDLREQSQRFLELLRSAFDRSPSLDPDGPAWDDVRQLLGEISSSRARRGFTPSETALFVFSLKQPLFERLRRQLAGDADGLAAEMWNGMLLLDKLGLYTGQV